MWDGLEKNKRRFLHIYHVPNPMMSSFLGKKLFCNNFLTNNGCFVIYAMTSNMKDIKASSSQIDKDKTNYYQVFSQTVYWICS